MSATRSDDTSGTRNRGPARRAAVAILGGSSAFTPSLASVLADFAPSLPELEVRLWGRDAAKVAAVARFCNLHARMRGAPHRYVEARSCSEAAQRADLVVHQLRVGGWRGRIHDDTFPLRFGIPGDETIGPGGLASAVRGVPVVLEAAREAAAASPGVRFVNLTNPLGIVLRALDGVEGLRPLGLCELPSATLDRVLDRIGARGGDVQPDYLGLNHQGWFVRLDSGGRDLLPDLLRELDATAALEEFRIEASVLRAIEALPLSYMRLYYHTSREVERLRRRAVPRGEELRQLSERLHLHWATTQDARLPEALSERETPWFRLALVPALVALLGGDEACLYVSERNRGDIPGLPAEAIVEKRCVVDAAGPRMIPFVGPTPTRGGKLEPFLEFLRRIARFESLALEAALDPCAGKAIAALAAHPLVPDEDRARDLAPFVLAQAGADPARTPAAAAEGARSRFDRLTEGAREKALLARLRSGAPLGAEPEGIDLPFFLKIQIQTTSRCVGGCLPCPYDSTRDLPQGEMSETLFRRVVDGIGGRGVERTGLFLMNEPLLDDRLEGFVRILEVEVPATTTLVYTNGLLLTACRAEALAEAGLDEVNVSVNAFDARRARRISPGIDFERVVANLRDVGCLRREGRLGSMEVRIVCLDLLETQEGEDALRESTGLEIFRKPITNRAGLVDVASIVGGEARPARRVACQRPFVKAYVLFNGDVILCNCDWRRTTVLGNVRETSLEAIWRGPRLQEIRRAHLRGELPEDLPCAWCDYPERIEWGPHAESPAEAET